MHIGPSHATLKLHSSDCDALLADLDVSRGVANSGRTSAVPEQNHPIWLEGVPGLQADFYYQVCSF